MLRQYKKSTTLTTAQRARIEANREAAKQRRQNLYEARRLIPYKPYSGETKYLDSYWSYTVIAGTGTVLTFTSYGTSPPAPGLSMNLISQGTAKTQRIGNKVKVYRIRLNGIVVLPAASTSGDIMRIILYEDKQANGGGATVANILEQNNMTSRQAMDYVDRIRVIKDRYYTVNPGAGTSGSLATPVCHFSMSHKCNTDIKYSSTTGAITEIQSNNFGVLAITAQGIMQLYLQSRVYYKDG